MDAVHCSAGVKTEDAEGEGLVLAQSLVKLEATSLNTESVFDLSCNQYGRSKFVV